MKKIISAIIFILFLGLNSLNVYAETTAITTPEQKSPYNYPQYDDTYFTYYNNLTGYKSNGLWGFYSKNNSAINIPPIYTDIKGMDSNYIKVKRNNKWGLIDTNGDRLLQPLYDSIESFGYSSNQFLIKVNGYYGVVDNNDNQIVPAIFQSITKINNSYLKVAQSNKYGIYSLTDNKILISVSYDDVAILDSYFKVKFGGKWGLIDKNQSTIVPAKYDDIKKLTNNYFTVKNNKVWGTVDKATGEEVIPPRYDKIEFGKANYLKVKHNGKWGATNYQGRVIIPATKGPLEINKELKKIY